MYFARFALSLRHQIQIHIIMSQKEVLDKMSDVLFWDVDKSQTDFERYPAFIIQRVLEYGNLQDWKLLRDYYGLNRIVDTCRQLRTLDPVCLAFISTISNTKKEDFRCYHTAQSNPTLWNS